MPEKRTLIDGVSVTLSQPVSGSDRWIGCEDALHQLLACWLTVAPEDLPLSPRIVGLPGMGKTTLAMSAVRARGQELYVFQCTSDTRPEDLLITPVLAENGKITYHASALVTAMVRGGACVLDEGNRMNEKSWASIAPLLDHRRTIESIIAGLTIRAHEDFRCCVTMNEDESTYEIPDYILSRLQPTLQVGYPSADDELAMLKYHIPFATEELLAMTVRFLQSSHELDLDFSPRDGLNILRFAIKRTAQNPEHPLAHDVAWREALLATLGEEALDLDALSERRRRTLGDENLPSGFADFFFSDDDPLRPDDDLL